LCRLTGGGVVTFDAPLLRPAKDSHAGQFGSVVADDHLPKRCRARDRYIQHRLAEQLLELGGGMGSRIGHVGLVRPGTKLR
jgi:hypothetical protein